MKSVLQCTWPRGWKDFSKTTLSKHKISLASFSHALFLTSSDASVRASIIRLSSCHNCHASSQKALHWEEMATKWRLSNKPGLKLPFSSLASEIWGGLSYAFTQSLGPVGQGGKRVHSISSSPFLMIDSAATSPKPSPPKTKNLTCSLIKNKTVDTVTLIFIKAMSLRKTTSYGMVLLFK